jgi:hypothetical protein
LFLGQFEAGAPVGKARLVKIRGADRIPIKFDSWTWVGILLFKKLVPKAKIYKD